MARAEAKGQPARLRFRSMSGARRDAILCITPIAMSFVLRTI